MKSALMVSIEMRYSLIFIAILISACSSKDFFGVYESSQGVYLDIRRDSTYQLYSQPWSEDFFESKGSYWKTSEDSIVFTCLSKSEKLAVSVTNDGENIEYTKLIVQSEFKQNLSNIQGSEPEDYVLAYFSLDSLNWHSIDFNNPIKIDGKKVVFKIEYLHGVLPIMKNKVFVSKWLPLEADKLNSYNFKIDFSQVNYLNTGVFTGAKVKKGIRIKASEKFLDTTFYRVKNGTTPFFRK